MQEGDYLYKEQPDGRFRVCRVLRLDQEFGVAHQTLFEPVLERPTAESIAALKIVAFHSPIAVEAIADYTVFANRPVAYEDLRGFHTYLKFTDFRRFSREISPEDLEEQITGAMDLYNQALALHDKRRHREAAALYHEAFEELPTMFEAKDNEAFCHMSLGEYDKAIACFEESIDWNGNTSRTDFSIGECLFKLARYREAEPWLEKAKLYPDLEPNVVTLIAEYGRIIGLAKFT